MPFLAAIQGSRASLPRPPNTLSHSMTNPEVSARTIQMRVHEFIQGTDEWLIGRDECVVHYHLTQRRTRAASEFFEFFQRLPGAGVRILDAKEMNITIHVSHEAVIIDHPGIRACRLWFVDQLEVTVHNRNSHFWKTSSCVINHCLLPVIINRFSGSTGTRPFRLA